MVGLMCFSINQTVMVHDPSKVFVGVNLKETLTLPDIHG
jgi:hypothetical protein